VTKELIAEASGTAGLLFIIVGSGIAAQTLGSDPGFQLLAHGISVGLGLGVLIALFQTVSGSHFNPSVTIAFWRAESLSGAEAVAYAVAQSLGALAGVALANITFGESMIAISQTARSGAGLVMAEAIATFILVLVILALVRTGRPAAVPAAVGAWVAAIVFATSSAGFANPAVTLARMFTDTYTGIAPASVAGFLAAQLIAGILAASAARLLFPDYVPQRAPA
jgi:glycerol uptake facilitator-like aquaporin